MESEGVPPGTAGRAQAPGAEKPVALGECSVYFGERFPKKGGTFPQTDDTFPKRVEHSPKRTKRSPNGWNIPPNGWNIFPNGWNIPLKWWNIPPNGPNIPPNGWNIFPNGWNIFPNGRSVPPTDGAFPKKGRSLSPEPGTFPRNAGQSVFFGEPFFAADESSGRRDGTSGADAGRQPLTRAVATVRNGDRDQSPIRMSPAQSVKVTPPALTVVLIFMTPPF